MRALLQRVTSASVAIDGNTVGATDTGLLILICAMDGDTDADADRLATKIPKLRIFKDADGRMNRALSDSGGAALVVSQFTLAANTSRGNRPGFSTAASPTEGERLYDYFVEKLTENGVSVETGRFGADMSVSLVNDGPVTIWIDTKADARR